MSLLEVRDLEVVAGGRPILRVDELVVGEGEVVAVLGPTGAGKTTLLRALHGIERPARGSYRWHDEPAAVPFPLERRRRITMVFQAPLLFRSDVLGNVARGLLMRGVARAAARERAIAALRLFHVEDLSRRPVEGLSGGEAQRVALARAVAIEPELLLLDEALASLDLDTREQVRAELLRVVRSRGISCVWVTHDQDEAQAVGDRVAVVDACRLLQVAPTADVFLRPASVRVAELVRTRNVLVGEGTEDGKLRIGPHLLPVPAPTGPLTVCIRPEDVVLAADGDLSGTVTGLRPVGAMWEMTMDCGGVELVALASRRSAVEVGATVSVRLPPVAVHLITLLPSIPS